MDNQNTNLPKTNNALMHEFIQKEMKELEVRQEEIKNSKDIAEIEAETRRQKNQLEHDVAMRGIEAQLQDRAKQMDTARQMQANEKSIWVLLLILGFGVTVTAMLTGLGKEIIELITYAITAIIGYFAGVAKGKFSKDSHKKIEPPED